MQCNIDPLGRRIRLALGLLSLTLGFLLLLLASLQTLTGWWPWFVAPTALLLGAFALYEATVGWCALRAMGLKTPL